MKTGNIRTSLQSLGHNSRLPLLQWPRSLPIDGEPRDVVERVERYDRWLAQSPEIPKLLLTFDPGPGQMVGPELVEWCTENIPGLEVQRCPAAGHHAPEDQPDAESSPSRTAYSLIWVDTHLYIDLFT